jgi:hypothetical protein
MSVPDNLSPRDFLRTSEFSPDRANRRFPNAQYTMLGGLFISHSGEDSVRIQDQIISPVVFERLPADGYFMHSRRSGGPESYKLLVQAALHWCDKFMVVISERSVSNFRSDVKRAQQELGHALDRLLARLPRRGRFAAR